MSSTEWEERGDAEQVDAGELGAVPPGSADEPAGSEGEASAGSGWTEGGGALPPEGEPAEGAESDATWAGEESAQTGAEEQLP